MEYKMFELITKMYSDLSARLDGIDKKMGNMDTDVKELRGDIIRIENDLGKKVDAALDGHKQVYVKQLEHDKHWKISFKSRT